MGTKADDIRSIASDGRYRPDTKLDKLCERLNLSAASEDATKDALNTILSEAVERVIEEREDKIRSNDPLVEDMAEILIRRSKNWIQPDDTDLVALVRMMYNSDFYDEINAGKSYLKSLENDLKQLRDRLHTIEDT